ncbi:hypothetical protein BDZ90DRAFT_231432 [Jaminaea rosea]|uniref:Uncharacterized protein n=1 Tax=Jaminaea rosea TaxID=1569628 RepID=A0A316UT25_9BASI|nr:hypothetical protein BDZ90DRAFT_231432 [Jaminaea rosea]PWN28449.1 hypothetical protein BDZ90DRAFT_231432 [Jaminaea rosea]
MPKSASHHADLATALLRASHAEIYPSTNGAPVPLSTSSEALLEASGTHLPSSTSSSSSFSPGTTADLLTILGKSGPWGFTYTDVLPLNVGLRIWHGDKDERIGLAGAFWLQKEWDAAPYGVECHVNVVKGAGHGLLTNGPVVVEVLESIAACCRERAARE